VKRPTQDGTQSHEKVLWQALQRFPPMHTQLGLRRERFLLSCKYILHAFTRAVVLENISSMVHALSRTDASETLCESPVVLPKFLFHAVSKAGTTVKAVVFDGILTEGIMHSIEVGNRGWHTSDINEKLHHASATLICIPILLHRRVQSTNLTVLECVRGYSINFDSLNENNKAHWVRCRCLLG
jgi:hypothetical protein